MIKLYIYCLVLIIGSVEVGPDIDMKFYQEVMEIVSYDILGAIPHFVWIPSQEPIRLLVRLSLTDIEGSFTAELWWLLLVDSVIGEKEM